MADLVSAIADSIDAEVPDASEWTIQRFARVWRNPKEGAVLSVYDPDEVRDATAAAPNTTGGFNTITTVILEYCEPALAQQQVKLLRDEDAEIERRRLAEEVLKPWGANHQSFPEAGCWKFEYLGRSMDPVLRAELLVRYFQMRFTAHIVQAYG